MLEKKIYSENSEHTQKRIRQKQSNIARGIKMDLINVLNSIPDEELVSAVVDIYKNFGIQLEAKHSNGRVILK